MKKIITSLLLLTTTVSIAQTEVKSEKVTKIFKKRNKKGLILKVGMNVSNVSDYNNSIDNDLKFSDSYALTYFYGFTKNHYLMAELMYNKLGFKNDIKTEKETYEATYSYNYLSLPLSYRFKINDLAIFGGGQFSYLVSDRIKTISTDEIETRMSIDKHLYKLNDFDISSFVGLSYDFKKLCIEARYNHGLTNFAKEAYQNATHRSVSIMLTRKF